MNVHLFIPCFVDQLFPQTAFNMIRVLEKAGCTVQYNTNQTCCGQPAFNAGFWDDAKDVCSKFIRDFSDAEIIVAPSASCVGFVRNYYSKLLIDSSHASEAKFVKTKLYEFTEFLTGVVEVEDVGAVFNAKVTYHDSCAALRECKIKEGPRKLLSNVKGLELIEMNDVETCCGFGGTFAVKFEPISTAMADQKVEHAIQTGAEYIISTDLSCLMHMDGYIKQKNYRIKTAHIADVLAGNS